VSKLTTDVVMYCTEASNQKSKYAYRKVLFFTKKALHRSHRHSDVIPWNDVIYSKGGTK